ncbi:MAG: hypothetical protein OFPI_39130 [Osedax symbiont Rs2]|nr:MAG: hypothetical protein OFPI_39130 [Osedax symbiont Rs2]
MLLKRHKINQLISTLKADLIKITCYSSPLVCWMSPLLKMQYSQSYTAIIMPLDDVLQI